MPCCRSPRRATTPSSKPCAAPSVPCSCPSPPNARPNRPIAPICWPSAAWSPSCRRARCRLPRWPTPCAARWPARRSAASHPAMSRAARPRRRCCIACSPSGRRDRVMASWQALADEAARWCDGGHTAQLWWREDDAQDAGPATDRLIALHRQTGVPLALAVVPAHATQDLADHLAGERSIDVLQHGYAHVNHASPSEKKIELGPHRPAMLVLGELGTGWLALERLFDRALPVLVPPWNRIAPALVPTLPEIGFRGLSTFGHRRPRARPSPPGLVDINTHVDLIDWQGSRGFVGEQAALGALVAALAEARTVSHEPVGMLSHHLAMDAGAWDFLSSFLEKARRMSGLWFCTARELFAHQARGKGEAGG